VKQTKAGLIVLFIICVLMVTGCNNNEIQALKKENDDLKIRLAKYEKVEENTQQKSEKEEIFDTPPVELTSIEFDKSGVTSVTVVFKNTSPKTLDAIEFVILQFDNLGRPAYRFNDKSHGNVTGELLLQENAQENKIIKGAWTLFNTERSTKGKVVIKQVHYTDNSSWVNQKFTEQINKEKDKL